MLLQGLSSKLQLHEVYHELVLIQDSFEVNVFQDHQHMQFHNLLQQFHHEVEHVIEGDLLLKVHLQVH